MDSTGPAVRKDDLCGRCLQPVPPDDRRCPHCGERMTRFANLSLAIPIAGVVVLFILVLVIYLVTRSSRTDSNPDPDSDTGALTCVGCPGRV